MGIFDSIANIFNAERSNKIQQDFAKHGIQYKVKDAKAAGINPYAALGASTTMPATTVGNVSGIDDAFGQAIDRAKAAGSTEDERVKHLAEKYAKLQVDNQEIQNNILRADLAKRTAQLAPPVPSFNQKWKVDGQGDAPSVTDVKIEPMKATASAPNMPGADPGAVNEIGWTRDPGGGYIPVPSKEAMERQSNDMLGMLMWNWRNRILPSLGFNLNPPPFSPPNSSFWRYSAVRQRYEEP